MGSWSWPNALAVVALVAGAVGMAAIGHPGLAIPFIVATFLAVLF